MSKNKEAFWNTPKGWAACLFIFAVSYFLFMEHRQHLFEYLPFFIIALCPLMHLFMHHNHGSHHHCDNKPGKDAVEKAYQRGLEDGKTESNKRQP